MPPRPPAYVDPLCVGLKRMLWRAVRRRCPRCGGQAWFVRWWKRLPRCRTCGFRYERDSGFSLGAITMNIGATFALIAVLLLVGFIASYPDVAVVPMLVVGAFICFIFPAVFHPISYTLWTAIDIAMHPLDAADVAESDIALTIGDDI
jgi:uncharacterized protein (DUF983 family)